MVFQVKLLNTVVLLVKLVELALVASNQNAAIQYMTFAGHQDGF